MNPYSKKRLTNLEIMKFAHSLGDAIFSATGRYELLDSAQETELFIKKNVHHSFYCKAIGAEFKITLETAQHFFRKVRSEADYKRRARLIAGGLEILEESTTLLVIDSDSGKEQGIVYYEILGKDSRLPGKIIVAKLSEVQQNGKIFWTVVDIHEK